MNTTKTLAILSKHNDFQFSSFYFDISEDEPPSVLQSLHTSMDGLAADECLVRLAHYGPNEIAREKKSRLPFQLLKNFYSPFILLLMALAVISFLTDDLPGGSIITGMVFMSVFLTFIQEYRSNKAAEKLRAMVSNKVTVSRVVGFIQDDQEARATPISQQIDVPILELVPGDVIHLSAGDMIPADVRVISAKDLFLSQSALTGEAIPVEKTSQIEKSTSQSLLERKNICFMGSSVVSGTAVAVVLKTGDTTYFGSIAKGIVGSRVLTSFDQGISRFTWLMIRFILVMVPLVFFINGLAKGNWVQAFTFALAVAVGLTPEMLSMIVTVNLAKGALAMSKKKVIVKRLNSIQNFGAMDVLCTDKTGTLTQDKVVLEKYVDCMGAMSNQVLKYAYLNSFYQTGLKNLLDRAVLDRVDMTETLHIQPDYRKVDEIPFDFSRRRMSVVVEEQGSRHVLICKGALEEVLTICSHAELPNKIVAVDPILRQNIQDVANLLNADGLRVIAVGYRVITHAQSEYTVNDEQDLTLIGFVAFLDPPKETAAPAIIALHKHGVCVKVLTGDNDIVTRKICTQVGLSVDRILLGYEIDAMSDTELIDATELIHVFAKLAPAQKQRLVSAMHSKGHVVGFMGDGINDAPALRAADVGISVDNAVDIAKESADIILLEKSLLVLVDGVIEGRKVFGNIIKYIKMGASSNFGNMLSVLGASILLPFLPMMPVQILVQNLLYDLSQTAIPFDQVDDEYLALPRRWEIGDIGKFMLCIGPVSSIFDYATFGLLWFFYKANTPAQQSFFQTGWFVEGLLSQTLIVHMIRTRKVPFFESCAATPLILATVLIMILGLIIPFSPLAPEVGMVPLPLSFFPWLFGFLLSYALLTQWAKTWFIRNYGYN